MPLSVGARVVLVGLSHVDLNGQLATVMELTTPKDPERVSVRLDVTRQVMAIRKTNLRASPDAECSSADGVSVMGDHTKFNPGSSLYSGKCLLSSLRDRPSAPDYPASHISVI